MHNWIMLESVFPPAEYTRTKIVPFGCMRTDFGLLACSQHAEKAASADMFGTILDQCICEYCIHLSACLNLIKISVSATNAKQTILLCGCKTLKSIQHFSSITQVVNTIYDTVLSSRICSRFETVSILEVPCLR